MFFLRYQTPEHAAGAVADVYSHFTGRMDVPAPLQLLSASPELLQLQFTQIAHFMRHPALSFGLLAAVRYLAAKQACFDYCRTLNRSWLTKSGLNENDLDQLDQGGHADAFSDEENALLRLVGKVLSKTAVTPTEVDAVRGLGWKDADILDACYHGTNLISISLLFEAFQTGPITGDVL